MNLGLMYYIQDRVYPIGTVNGEVISDVGYSQTGNLNMETIPFKTLVFPFKVSSLCDAYKNKSEGPSWI